MIITIINMLTMVFKVKCSYSGPEEETMLFSVIFVGHKKQTDDDITLAITQGHLRDLHT